MTKRCRHNFQRKPGYSVEVCEKCMSFREAKKPDDSIPIWSDAEGGRAAYCQHSVDSQVHCCICH